MGGEDVDKIVRIPGDTLLIKLSPDEQSYRQKYLPDPKKLTDEKLVCTVCSIPLAQDIHRGKDIFVHRALQVLVCENCYNFYGDGCFSADEDGDDKYCRWCGQGGTLFLCSACNCAFCQKCTKQNLKSSVLAELDNDDWKCYICNPRPLFGCRTICWGAQQLNKIGKQKEQERLRKQRERLEKLEARKKEPIERKSRKASTSEDETLTKKRRRGSDSDSSSPEVMPQKRSRRDSRSTGDNRSINGSTGRRRRKDSSSNSESEKKVTRPSRSSSKKGKTVDTSSSEDESDNKSKKDRIKKKNKKKGSSDESTDEEHKRPKRKTTKKRDSSSDDSSENRKSKTKKRLSKKKKDESSDSSSGEKSKKLSRKKKKGSSSEESSGDNKKKGKKHLKKKNQSLSENSSDEDDSQRSKKKTKTIIDKEGKIKKSETAESDNELKKGKKVVDNDEGKADSAEDILVKKRIKLAVLWLSSTVKDISELGTLISVRATKFGKRKINAENLKTYEDVLKSVSKIKQLISGVHSNYDHIEKALESKLVPWKRMTGMEETENGKNVDRETSVALDSNASKSGDTSAIEVHGNSEINLNDTVSDKSQIKQVNGTNPEVQGDKEKVKMENEVTMNWSDESDEDQNETRDLISKANETLDKAQNEELELESNEKRQKNSELHVDECDIKKDHERSTYDEPAQGSDDRKDKGQAIRSKEEADKSVTELRNDTPKKMSPESKKDAKETSEKSSKNSKFDEELERENEDSSSIKTSTPLKVISKEEKTDEGCENEESSSKEKMNLEGNDSLHGDVSLDETQLDSSDEDSPFKSFSKRLEAKWHSGTLTEEMNLKQSSSADSSDQRDGDKEIANSTENGKKKSDDHTVPKLVLKKIRLEEGEECNELETTSSSSKATEKRSTGKYCDKVKIKKEKEGSNKNESEDKKNRNIDTQEKVNIKSNRKKTETDKPKTSEYKKEKEKDNDTSIKIKKNTKENKSKRAAEVSEIKDSETGKKINHTTNKNKSKEGNSRCLSSEEELEEIETKRKVVKSTKKSKAKKDSTKGLSSEDEEDVKSKKTEGKEKSKSQNSKSEEEEDKDLKTKDNIKKKKTKYVSKSLSEDEEANLKAKSKTKDKRKAEGNSRGLTSEDENINDEDIKSKSREKGIKRKKNTEEENCDKDNKIKSKSARKINVEEKHSDDDNAKNCKSLKKSNDSKLNVESSENIEISKKEKAGHKKESLKKSEDVTVVLDSSCEEKDDIQVIENGVIKENDSEKSRDECQDNEGASNDMIKEEDTDFDEMKGILYNEEGILDVQIEIGPSDSENSNGTGTIKEESLVKVKDDKKVSDVESSNKGSKVDVKKKEAKFIGFESSSEGEDSSMEEKHIEPKKNKSPKRKSEHNQRKLRNAVVLSSDEEMQNNSSGKEDDDKDESFSPMVLSDADSSDSDILPKNKRKKKSNSDSDVISLSDEDIKKKKKRKRLMCANSSDESGGSGTEKLDVSQKSNQGESPGKGGRKNIKKIKKKDDLEDATIEAAEEEKERRRRIEERQKLFNQVFEVKESAKLEKLVLDFDPESKKELISVDSDLVAKMKPHQAKGVKFMWDSCFESVKQVKKNKGSGCILAHCMGLGKTFQVISLVHTLLIHEELTKVRTVMVVCPLSTVLNWYNEFGKWLEGVEGADDIEVFHLTKFIKNPDRGRELRRWQHNGGVLIIGYEMFRNLTSETNKKFKAKLKKDFQETLIDPGADLIICDEGHMLKNEATALSKAMSKVKTARRIVLTGTPMQNNLKEYHCMVQFVKPSLLGTSKEFLNRFVNPINNGQFVDSTEHDVKLMKRRAHVLHKMLEGLVQRFDYNVLTPFLPPKQEYVISVSLSELQEKLYNHYLENCSQKAEGTKAGTRLFQDWQALGRIWTHPRVLKISTDKANWLKEKKAMEESDSEGSLKDFIDDDSEDETSTPEESDESSGEDGKKKKNTVRSRSTRSTRQNAKNFNLLESSEDEKNDNEGVEASEDTSNKGEWWSEFIEPQHFEDMRQSGKLLLLFAILKECELIEDKILVFSQSLFSLDLIEYFLDKIDAATQEGHLDENLDNHQGTWSKGLDYFRLDGSTSSENRNIWCKAFNREDNPRARLFLISTRAGGLGINLTAANRVIIFDASWNPSHDIQSIFRIYRFGQKKPCYVYRFVAFGTMEEKVYERQVAKQSISNRVVDEQQVHRHFTMSDLNELYTFTRATKLEDKPTFALPRDPLMAEILSQMKQWIEKYHEHDSLLENVVEEELNEEERKAAWEDYENDKKRGFMPAAQGPAMNPNSSWNVQIEFMRQQLKTKFPEKSDEEIHQILVYQVSLLMKQQQQQQLQMAAQMQAASNASFQQQMMGGQMFNARQPFQTTPFLRNIAPKPQTAGGQQQGYNAQQVYRMQQQANLARLQMQQQQLRQQQMAQQKRGQSMLAAQLGQQPYRWQQPTTNYPTANISAALNNLRTAELLQMKQNYQASKGNKPPGLTITEITEDAAPSKSNET